MMRSKILLPLLFISFFGCKEIPYDISTFEQNELLKYKVDEDRFELGWFPESTTEKPLFRDYSIPDKEIAPDPNIEPTSIYHPSNQPIKIGLTLMTDSISLDNRKKLIAVSGKIMGGHNSTKPDDFKVYIGKRKDTTVNITYMMSPHIDNYYKGEKIDKDIDFKVPAFYLTDPQQFPVELNGETNENILHITTLINEKSVLVLALNNSYVEVFEIGKLLVP